MPRRHLPLWVFAAALAATACSNASRLESFADRTTSLGCNLRLDDPGLAHEPLFTAADDRDPDQPGLQIDVALSGRSDTELTRWTLYVNGEPADQGWWVDGQDPYLAKLTLHEGQNTLEVTCEPDADVPNLAPGPPTGVTYTTANASSSLCGYTPRIAGGDGNYALDASDGDALTLALRSNGHCASVSFAPAASDNRCAFAEADAQPFVDDVLQLVYPTAEAESYCLCLKDDEGTEVGCDRLTSRTACGERGCDLALYGLRFPKPSTVDAAP